MPKAARVVIQLVTENERNRPARRTSRASLSSIGWEAVFAEKPRESMSPAERNGAIVLG